MLERSRVPRGPWLITKVFLFCFFSPCTALFAVFGWAFQECNKKGKQDSINLFSQNRRLFQAFAFFLVYSLFVLQLKTGMQWKTWSETPSAVSIHLFFLPETRNFLFCQTALWWIFTFSSCSSTVESFDNSIYNSCAQNAKSITIPSSLTKSLCEELLDVTSMPMLLLAKSYSHKTTFSFLPVLLMGTFVKTWSIKEEQSYPAQIRAT